jgi:hypothetical protein
MEGDYPTEDELKTIRTWDHKDPFGLVDYILPYWEQNGWAKKTGKKIVHLQLSTGGWSGNESIVAALDSFPHHEEKDNNMFFFLWWKKSVRGGHYWFRVKQLK